MHRERVDFKVYCGRVSAQRGKHDPEFELIDTGVFEGNRYFDVFVEYAKATANDILVRITAINRGPEPATIHLLPHLWYRNTWNWTADALRPVIKAEGESVIRLFHPEWVVKIDVALRSLPDALITERLTLERLVRVYPFTLRRPDQADISMLLARVADLKDFVTAAAKAGEWLMVAVD